MYPVLVQVAGFNRMTLSWGRAILPPRAKPAATAKS
jgi:hypothetical protein